MQLELVATVSDRERKWIANAVNAYREKCVEDVEKMIENGRAQLWFFKSDMGEGIVITQIFAKESELFVWLIAGKGMAAFGNAITAYLEQFAKYLSLQYITSNSTPKMARYLSKCCGFAIESVSMRKDV